MEVTGGIAPIVRNKANSRRRWVSRGLQDGGPSFLDSQTSGLTRVRRTNKANFPRTCGWD